jgi:hypothetical protein
MTMSSELERAVLGALALQPNLMENCLVRAYDFTPGRYRETFAALTAIWEDERPAEIDPLLLAERIGGDGVQAFVASLLDGSIKLDPNQFCRRVTELRKRFLTSRIESVIGQQAKIGELDLDEIRADLEEYDSLSEDKAFDPTKILLTGADIQAIDMKVEYTVDKLAPCRSLILLHGPAGLAKTWLALCICKAVSEGVPFLGLPTKQRFATYIDYENPFPNLADRIRKLNIQDVRFWHLSFSPRPPKLDGPDWTLYKALPSGLIVFDTARSSFEGDENSSQDVGLVMNRLKELRELNNDVILLHHTPRRNERASKGSTAWEDMADHVLAFYKVKKETLEDTDEEVDFDPRALLSLGTGRKTRFEPFRMYITLDPENGGFSLEEDPKATTIDAIANYISGEGCGKNQGEIISWAREAGIGPKMRSSFIAVLNRGEGKRWRSHKGFRGAKCYEPTT